MNQLNFHYIIWFAKSSAKNLGIWGLFGVFLVFGSIIFLTVKVGEVKENVQLAKIEQLNQFKKNLDLKKQKESEPPPLNAAEEVSQFYSKFPTLDALPNILSELNKIAKSQGIEIEIGDYRLNALKSSAASNPRDLTKYDVSFPLKGQYSQIMKFITDTLEKFPEIALMDLQVIREEISSPTVEATVVFAVYVKVNK